MVTKSRSSGSVLWSIVAIAIAVVSIGYCFTHILEVLETGFERSARAISYITRIVKGSASV